LKVWISFKPKLKMKKNFHLNSRHGPKHGSATQLVAENGLLQGLTETKAYGPAKCGAWPGSAVGLAQ
jgi:hypothetical protein